MDARTNSISNTFANTPLYLHDQDWLNSKPTSHENTMPNTIFHIKTTERDAIASGTITDTESQPLEGVQVDVEGFVNTSTSDAEGKYSMLSMPYSDLTLTASLFGYYDNEKIVTFGQVSETTVDFTMEMLPNVGIKGIVLSNDYNKPVANAVVSVEGYETYNTTTATDGSFIVENVYVMQDYSLTIHHPEMDSYTQDISVNIDTLDLGNIIIDETETSAYNLVASLNDELVNLAWNLPYTSKKLDLAPADTVSLTSDNYLANEPYEDIQIGNLFRLNDTATLTSFTFKVVGYNFLEENGEITIKLYNNERVLVVESEPFIMPNEPMWLTVNVPNITFTHDFYGMIHWNKLPKQTPFIGFDYNDDDVAYAIENNDGEFKKLSDIIPGYIGAVRMTATLDVKDNNSSKNLENYSVYRKPAGQDYLNENWKLIACKFEGA